MRRSPGTNIVTYMLLALGAWPSGSAAQQAPAQKKLIEYGWDVRNPAYVREHIREMEKLPFDGLIMRMAVGGRVLVKEKWAEESVADDFEQLRSIEWGTLTDNFLIMYAASEVDWFSDADWEAVCHNVGLTARAAKLGRCKGLCFDAEPYGTNPWHYPTQAHAQDKSFAEYEAQVRKRGAQFMKAITDEMPEVVLHTFFLLGYFGDLWHMDDLDARAEQLSTKHYALYPAFINGMLDAAGPGVIITDGNESAYYYQDALSFYRAYHAIRQSALAMVAPDNTGKYRTQVQASQALYVDHLLNLRTQEYLSAYLEPDERAKWFEHNVYYALTTTDEYVWLYSERMNWWTNENIPPGLEEAVRSARAKVQNHQPLGLDIEPILEAGREREREAIRASLIQRSAEIARLPEGTPAPTAAYEVVREVNARVEAWKPELLGRRSTGVFTTGLDAEDALTPADGLLVRSADDGLLIGILTAGDRDVLAMVVDSRVSPEPGQLPAREARVTFGAAVDSVTALAAPDTKTRTADGNSAQVSLPAGGGQLLRLQGDGVRELAERLEGTRKPTADMPPLGPDGLMAHWTFDEGEGNVAHDGSGLGNDLTLSSPAWTEGKLGSALDLTGQGSMGTRFRARLPDVEAMSIEAWVKPVEYPSEGYGCVLYIGRGSTSRFEFGFGPDNVYPVITNGYEFAHGNLYVAGMKQFIPPGTWGHIAVVAGPDGAAAYVNGARVRTTDFAGTFDFWGDRVELGSRDGREEFEGLVDEIRIWGRKLTEEEVGEHYRNPQ